MAEAYQHQLTAILLSGANRDGADGLRRVHELGGNTLVQTPSSAEYPVMPEAGLTTVPQARRITPDELKRFLVILQ